MESSKKYLFCVDLFKVEKFGVKLEGNETYKTFEFNTEDEARKVFEEYKSSIAANFMNYKDDIQGVSLNIWQWNDVNGDYTDAVVQETYSLNSEVDRNNLLENYY